MVSTDDVLVEDWQGLESELERLFMIYGYPVDDLQDTRDQEESEANIVEGKDTPRNETAD